MSASNDLIKEKERASWMEPFDNTPESKKAYEKSIEPESNILDDAKYLTSEARRRDYGDVKVDFVRIANMWEVILGVKVEPKQVALCMIALKISRETNKSKRDNWVDIAGYARCGSMCDE